jgi:cell division septation protein DedD
VSDVTQDFAEDGFHEIHLSGKHVVFLFMATTVIAVVVFLCGVLVGRGVRSRQSQDTLLDPVATAAAVTPAATPVPAADAGPQAAEPPAPPAETDELSYKKRLEGDVPRESLKPQSSTPAAPPHSSPPPPATPSSAAAAPPAPTAGGAPQPGTWIVQVHALRDRAVANGIVQRLAAKGYPAYLVPAGPPTGTFKVQVGRYKDREEAMRVIERLKKEEQFNPWITR